MAQLPWRGPGGPRPDDIPLPPGRMPMLDGTRLRKHWRYVGLYGPELSLCVGSARIGPLRQSWWAVWDRAAGRLRERTATGRGGVTLAAGRVRVRARDVALDLEMAEDGGVEVVSPTGEGRHIWTRKRLASASGTLEFDGGERRLEGTAFIDDSDGYHDRHTVWRWSAGTGIAQSGATVAWNLVDGVHDSPSSSERTVWVDGEPTEIGRVRFSDDLSAVAFSDGGELRFDAEAVRSRDDRRVVFRSRYEQPFGAFSGELPGGVVLREGFGVMEFHDVLW